MGWGRRGWDGVAVKLPVGQFKASIVSRRVSLITVVRLPCGIRIGYWYRWRPIVLGMLCGIVLTLDISNDLDGSLTWFSRSRHF